MADPVLFARGGALGDFVLTLPVLDALLAGPAPVEVAMSPRWAPLLALRPGPAPARVIDLGGPEALWMFGGRPPRRYARAVAFSRAVGEGLRVAGVPEVAWVDATPAGPAGAHFARVLGPAGAGLGPPRLRPPDRARDAAVEAALAGPPPVVLAPGSGGADKRLPLSWWAELARRIPGPVVWVAGPVEAGEAWPAAPLRPDLPDTARLAADCRAWIGADSGPSHLAAAARRGAGRDPEAVVVLFRTTDPGVWAPAGATVVPAGSPDEQLRCVERRSSSLHAGESPAPAAGDGRA